MTAAGVIDTDRQEAARLLLATPLVTAAANPDGLSLIRRHSSWLTEQFSQILGYRLVIEATFARLYKTAVGDASRPALRAGTGSPLNVGAYTYLALIVSVLLTAREQMLLSGLVADVRNAGAEACVEVGDSISERRALVAALRVLVEWGVIVEEENSVSGYSDSPDHEVLLTVRRELVRHLIAGPLRQATSPDDLVRLASAALVGGARHRVRRRLVETPVVYRDALADEDRDWMAQYQRREADVLGDFLGVDLEIRAEGIAAFHPELTDRDFPASGTVAQAALLTLSSLVARLRPDPIPHPRDALMVGVAIPDGTLEEVLAGHVTRHRSRWGQAWVDDPDALADEVRALLADMGLIAPADPELGATRPGTGAWVLLAAAARYAAEEKIVERPAPNLFVDEPDLPGGNQ